MTNIKDKLAFKHKHSQPFQRESVSNTIAKLIQIGDRPRTSKIDFFYQQKSQDTYLFTYSDDGLGFCPLDMVWMYSDAAPEPSRDSHLERAFVSLLSQLEVKSFSLKSKENELEIERLRWWKDYDYALKSSERLSQTTGYVDGFRIEIVCFADFIYEAEKCLLVHPDLVIRNKQDFPATNLRNKQISITLNNIKLRTSI